ncbi:unnamed protein product [Amoebophrya sp. A25]|nr:unnamed protein product [Amoebophrya sp. A25]|eukprot:GSA25T00001228001.1
MFVYLAKKIAIPHNLNLQVISWNLSQGWIACGGERGLLKVIKLESTGSDGSKSNLSMNQTLEGHQGCIMVATWNENFRKLTTSDQNGLIIVWMLHRGIWFEEMINNRNRSVVKDMKWTPDGQKICIIYEDGAVIVGTVDGQRLWGKELKTQLQMVEWAPDGRNILFSTPNGDIHLYDPEGVYVLKIPVYCLDEGMQTQLAGIHWYDGTQHRDRLNIPSLACAYENGRVQLLRNESDDRPVLIDSQMRCTGVRWNPAGTVVALAGMQNNGSGGEVGIVQFYGAQFGEHLRTLRLPGNNLRSLSWEGSGLRLALAVDHHIFFANVRPDYIWDYFGKTLVYAAYKKERSEYTVVFWNTAGKGSGAGSSSAAGGGGSGSGGGAGGSASDNTGSSTAANAKTASGGGQPQMIGDGQNVEVKTLRHVVAIKAAGEHCVIVTKTEENVYQIHLCNEIGSPLEKKEIVLHATVKAVAMTRSHVIVATADVVYVWNYINHSKQKVTSQKRTELMFSLHDDGNFVEKEEFQAAHNNAASVEDGIGTVCASDVLLLVGRESGAVQKYTLPFLQKDGRFSIKMNPSVFQLNCHSTKLLTVDINGILSLYDVDKRKGQVTQLPFERKDVWHVKWASDNGDLFTFMEKSRMYIVRGTQPEEPVLSSGYICEFKDLEIRSALVDDLMRAPEQPSKPAIIMDFETKSLRDTRDILTKLSNLKDAFQYVEDNPHPRLWRLLAESALDQLEFQVAEKAFVKYEDYAGIQFVKRLKLLSDKVKQKAEVAGYFQRFDEAESLYREIDRRDLSIELRLKLGDWFRVIQLVQGSGGSENLLQEAYNNIGDYYADRSKWSHAAQYYTKARNYDQLVEAYYNLEDYDSLARFISMLPEGSPLLGTIGEKLVSVGLCEEGVKAYLRLGDSRAAIDACALLNEWDLAVELARKENFADIETLLGKYAQHFLEKGDPGSKIEAIQLYKKANRFGDACKWIMNLGDEVQKSSELKAPDKMKKIFLLAALELEKKREKAQKSGPGNMRSSADNISALHAMMDIEGSEPDFAYLQPWRACEAYHILMLCQRQLYEHQIDKAMRSAIRLTDYEDILDPKTIYCLVALTTYQTKFFLQCSRAFIKLRNYKKFESLALQIFTSQAPRDPSTRMVPCPSCQSSMQEWQIQCSSCGHKLPFCVASGRSIFGGEDVVDCRTCHRKTYATESRSRVSCALCHARSPTPSNPTMSYTRTN